MHRLEEDHQCGMKLTCSVSKVRLRISIGTYVDELYVKCFARKFFQEIVYYKDNLMNVQYSFLWG